MLHRIIRSWYTGRWWVDCYIQRGGAWAGYGTAQSLPRCTKCNSPPINGQCTNHCIAIWWSVAVKGLMHSAAKTSYWPMMPGGLLIEDHCARASTSTAQVATNEIRQWTHEPLKITHRTSTAICYAGSSVFVYLFFNSGQRFQKSSVTERLACLILTKSIPIAYCSITHD